MDLVLCVGGRSILVVRVRDRYLLVLACRPVLLCLRVRIEIDFVLCVRRERHLFCVGDLNWLDFSVKNDLLLVSAWERAVFWCQEQTILGFSLGDSNYPCLYKAPGHRNCLRFRRGIEIDLSLVLRSKLPWLLGGGNEIDLVLCRHGNRLCFWAGGRNWLD